MLAPLLHLTNIQKSFMGVHALRGVSFELLPAEVHALVGENGAGKSTLVKVVTGAIQPDAGTIELAGNALDCLTPSRARNLGIACIYQHPALFPDLTVAENIGLRLNPSSALCRVDWTRHRDQAHQLLQQVGADIPTDTPVRELSMPNQQLVEITCALGTGARVVIMDEPTACLTEREQHLLFALVRSLRQQGVGVVYVSHRLEEVFALADRVTVLRDGEKISTSRTADLTESSLIRLMVGRDLSSNPRPPKAPAGTAPKQDAAKALLDTPGPVALCVRNIGCSFSGVQDVSFDLHSGEILGLAGLVGAGRTELARTLFGITPADSGELMLGGRKVAPPDSPRSAMDLGFAYVPEDRVRHGIILDLPIDQNITLAIHQRIFPGGWLRPKVERKLAWQYVRALDLRTTGPEALAASLSGGNQQKVSIARWLATNPKVLILDEPTQGVDVGAKCEIHKLIRDLASQGLAVLLISSELPELVALSDRIGVMRGGKLVELLPGNTSPHQIMAAAFGQSETER